MPSPVGSMQWWSDGSLSLLSWEMRHSGPMSIILYFYTQGHARGGRGNRWLLSVYAGLILKGSAKALVLLVFRRECARF